MWIRFQRTDGSFIHFGRFSDAEEAARYLESVGDYDKDYDLIDDKDLEAIRDRAGFLGTPVDAFNVFEIERGIIERGIQNRLRHESEGKLCS